MQNEYGASLQRSGINGESYFIIGGEIGGGPHEIYLVYAQGNCISPSAENPFLQIGESKYGKPILDRVIGPETTLEDASRAALVSIDSTIRSNITVGPPVELCIVRAKDFTVSQYLKLQEQDVFYKSITQHWNEGLKGAFTKLPRFPWESLAPELPPQVNESSSGMAQPMPGPVPEAPQPQELSEHVWHRQLG